MSPEPMLSMLHRPPAFALAAGLAILAVGALTGAVLIGLQDWLYALARAEIIRRPEIHGFAGAEVIDAARIAEVADQANTALRMAHTHALGIGLLILIAAVAISNLQIPAWAQSVCCGLVSLGALYPVGWLVLAWLIPYWGVDRLRAPVEWIVFVPFGGALVLGLWAALALYLMLLAKRLFGGPQ
jgi:hypothetical protein